jgi:predicted nuclease of restriction endonuclease-like (RecB) superfamily
MENENNYLSFLNKLRSDTEQARLKVVLTVNEQLLELYWNIGKNISQQITQQDWGTKIIERLSGDLVKSFPDMKGISPRNLKYMQTFAEAYPEFLQAPLAKLPWYHHITLLDKVKDSEERFYYISEAIKNGWSRNVLVNQIESNLYARKGNAVTNFSATLPPVQSDLAQVHVGLSNWRLSLY